MTRVTRYIAFDTIRASAIDYRYASRDSRWGVVRFHKTRDAAERTVGSSGRVEVARIATREEVAADRAAKAAAKAARAARDPFAPIVPVRPIPPSSSRVSGCEPATPISNNRNAR